MRGSACVAAAIRYQLEHDPEKWPPVFGKDHAQEENLVSDSAKSNQKLGRRPLDMLFQRESADHGGALADGGPQGHRAAMQFDEGADDRQAKAGAAMARALRMGLEPVEHPALHLGRNARSGVGTVTLPSA